MGQATARVLALLERLQSGGLHTGPGLADDLGVDTRTLRRDVARLQRMGVPVQTTRGRDGGYRLAAGYRLPPLMFNPEEALALAVGLLAARRLGLEGLAPAVAGTQAKLERVLPPAQRRQLADIDATVSLDVARPFARSPGAPLLSMAAAARQQQSVEIDYRAADDAASTRGVDVYGLGWRGAWYAVGWCHLRQDLRAFRLDRVQAVRPLPRSFARPEGFDVLGHLARGIGTLPRAHAVEVRLSTTLEEAQRHVWAELGELHALPRGGVQLRAQADDLDWMARELARLPMPFRIVKPPRLKRVLADLAQRLQAVAESGPVSADPRRAAGRPRPAATR